MLNETQIAQQRQDTDRRVVGAVENELSKIRAEGNLPSEYDLTHDKLVRKLQDAFATPGRRYGQH